jgi:HTH-type transcriptional repressor of NAD biosynthesis genes
MTDPIGTHGLVLGKFMPPHQGHVYLIDFARHYTDSLTVVVETEPDQPIPGDLRFKWVREMFPDVNVVHLTDCNPQDQSEHPDFWNIWHDSLMRIVPQRPDLVFASENYGNKLASTLGARFVPVDIERSCVPVSGTDIREAPMIHWEYIPRCVRPYFVRRVCIFGPESTGKTTLTRDLATHFNTVAVPEYARTHLEQQNGTISAEDIPLIARGQMAAEDSLAFNANRLLFCDTDLVLTTIWSNRLYDTCPDWICREASHRQYDLYLVTDVDVPWVEDSVRYLPDERQSFLNHCVEELDRLGRPFRLISGDWTERFESAVDAVNVILSSTPEPFEK